MSKWLVVIFVLPVTLGAQRSAYPSRAVETVVEVGKGRVDVFAGFTGMAVSKDGSMYVLEGRPCTVKVFDITGKQIRAFGSVGSGKGQCRTAGAIRIDDSIVVITDPPRTNGDEMRLVKFDLNGKARDVEAGPPSQFTRPLLARRGTTIRTAGNPGGITVYAVKPDGAADTLFSYKFDIGPIKRGETTTRGSNGFGASGAWATYGDSILAFADGYTGAVKWYRVDESGAKVFRTAEMGVKPDTVTADEVAAQAQRMSQIQRVLPGQPAPPPVAITILEPPPYWSLASFARFSSDGSLWVTNQRRAQYTMRLNGEYQSARVPYTVFPAVGEPYSVNLPVAFTPYAIIGDLVYGYAINSLMGSLMVFRLK